MPEVAGDVAQYVDLEFEGLWCELGRRGRRRADNARWEVTAEKTWNFWERLLGG